MPLHEYRCEACGERTEVLQKLHDPPLAVCPSCGGALKRLLSAPAFQFKGSGWYVTDYARSSGAKESAKGDAGASPNGKEGSGGAKSEPAPATGGGESKSDDKPAAPKATSTDKS